MAIAIDAMGGDLHPRNPVLGAVKAVNEKNIGVVLVGNEPEIKRILNRCRYKTGKIEIVHSTDVVEMDEPVASALRTKKDSSMRVCFQLHKNGDVQGVVSAGNSGAMLAIGRFVLKMIPGIDRPCIGAILPSMNEKVLLVDAGANINCSPEQLLQFAILGYVYMEHFHSVKNPRIGLLNVGIEERKGDVTTRKAYQLLKECSLNFVGNIEGREFFNGHVDVVVTDGYAGNILLKSVQGAASFIKDILEQEIKSSLLTKLGSIWLTPALRRLKERTDYAKFGGAPLLGLKGNGIICHGSSSPEALFHGINLAKWAEEQQLVRKMEEEAQDYEEILTLS